MRPRFILLLVVNSVFVAFASTRAALSVNANGKHDAHDAGTVSLPVTKSNLVAPAFGERSLRSAVKIDCKYGDMISYVCEQKLKPKERTLQQRAMQAVGALALGSSKCGGVILGKAKCATYFLMAVQCVPPDVDIKTDTTSFFDPYTYVPKSRFTYKMTGMHRELIGVPLISAYDGTIVGLHLCGLCEWTIDNIALSTKAMLVDLEAKGYLLEFTAPPGRWNDW